MEQREESGTCLGYALQGGGKPKVKPSAIKLALDYAEAKKRSDEIQSDLHSCCFFDVNTLVFVSKSRCVRGSVAGAEVSVRVVLSVPFTVLSCFRG